MRARQAYIPLLAVLAVSCSIQPPAPLTHFPKDPEERGPQFAGFLRLPEGEGPFPALVLLHTCAGLRAHVFDWASDLAFKGYVTLVVDSFSQRGVKSVCGSWQVSVDQVAADAIAAAEHLRTLPKVKPDDIGVVGFSYGGMAALRLASARYIKANAKTPFQAAAAFYPWCTQTSMGGVHQNNFYGDIGTPLQLIVGSADKASPPVESGCTSPAQVNIARGQPVSLVLLDGVQHLFDDKFSPAYDRAALDRATMELHRFLDRYLSPQRAGSSN